MIQSKKPQIETGFLPTPFIIIGAIVTLFYFSWWLSFGHISQPVLYGLLFLGEVYHVIMVLLFWFTIRGLGKSQPTLPSTPHYVPAIDVFITVAGEPLDVVKHTVEAVKRARYPNKNIFILNDSFVAGKENWKDYELLAKQLQIGCITRKTNGGAKAGNINHGMRQTNSELVAIFDADMAPDLDFFEKTIPYFVDEKLGFVQTPQYYKNYEKNMVTRAAWEQQEFFFGPILRGKQVSNAAFICGTNVVLRRKTLDSVGGIDETSIAEDFITSVFVHQKGWKSIYVPEVLAQGLAPEDVLSYYKQQLRWARGSLEVLFKYNPLFVKGLTISQRLEYLSSALYYCNGWIVAIDAMVPLFFLFFGISPIIATTTVFALYFLPFMAVIIYSLHVISNKSMTLRAISFTQSSWFLQIQAFISAMFGIKMNFAVTSKTALSGNYLYLVFPHLIYISIAFASIVVAVLREGLTPSVITNISWVLFNVSLFIPFINAALPKKNITPKPIFDYA